MSVNLQAKQVFARFHLPGITSTIALTIGLSGCAILTTSERSFAYPVPVSINQPIESQSDIAPEVILIRQAIIGQESGANFRAINRHSGALG
ncbi:lytic transglycosylase domain-containing protein, partial [Pseudanabaenaceae cyanobacterium LEGE 13415]|nr:lytic transglycosylase domain-containing protein [Pseudanabaenaceae cyanobacterium LEGE 13415]